MKKTKNKIYSAVFLSCFGWGVMGTAYGMGLRSFVALPVEKGGGVIRLVFEHEKVGDTDTLTSNVAYGISGKQTLLLGMPYRLSPAGDSRRGDLSALYRHIVWQDDTLQGTKRLGLLGGVIAPTGNGRDAAVQGGFVFTHFKNRNEIDLDALYQAGIDDRPDSGRYDISWQYRLLPTERPDWGIAQELNGVLELSGRWKEGSSTTHQVTAGFQWIHPKWVFEGGATQNINNENELRYILSSRIHF